MPLPKCQTGHFIYIKCCLKANIDAIQYRDLSIQHNFYLVILKSDLRHIIAYYMLLQQKLNNIEKKSQLKSTCSLQILVACHHTLNAIHAENCLVSTITY